MEETELIKLAQHGDAKAFEQLIDNRYDTIYRFAYKWCGNAMDAQDIAQQACVKLARNLKQFRFESAFSSWLYRLVINCAKDWQKTHNRYQTQTDHLPEQASSSSTHESAIYLQQILEKVSRLGEGFRETLLLVMAEGFTHKEVAHILGTREGTVSWRMHEIRKSLNLLHEKGVE